MAVTQIDKESGSIIIIEDGRKQVQSVRAEDTVISVPIEGFKKVLNIYVHPDTGQLVVVHES